MKVRKGFVSNSSSSSFLIYGITVESDGDQIKEVAKKLFSNLSEERTKWIEYTGEGGLCSEDVNSILEEALEAEGFSVSCPFEDDYYIGRSWDTVRDDETGWEFKKSVEDRLTELFGTGIKCMTLEEAWRDG